MVKNKKLAVKPEGGALTTAIPAHLKGEGRGFGAVSKEDILLPRIKLLQPLSPEVTDAGMKPGTMLNSLSQTNYGNSIIFIPIIHQKSRIKWFPRDDGGGIECSSDDAKQPREGTKEFTVKDGGKKKTISMSDCVECQFAKWTDDVAPLCTIYYNFPILIIGEEAPVALSFEKTKVKTAKKLISLTRYVGGNLDMFAKKYELKTVVEKNSQGQTYFNYVVAPKDFCNPAEYKKAEAFFLSLKGHKVKLEQDEE